MKHFSRFMFALASVITISTIVSAQIQGPSMVPSSIPSGTPFTGCGTPGGLLYNSSNTITCASGLTSNGTALLGADGTTALPTYSFSSSPDMGFMKTGSSIYYAQTSGLRIRFSSAGLWVGATSQLGWASTASAGAVVDTAMARNAAGVVEVNNGTNGTFGDLRLKNVLANAATGIYGWSAGSQMLSPVDGNILFRNAAGTSFNLLQFGGTTSSFVALKSAATIMQVRLGDDSGFANIRGKLTTDLNFVGTPVVATGYMTLYDATGTAYKVPACLASGC